MAVTVNNDGWTSLWDLSQGRTLTDHHIGRLVEHNDIDWIDIDAQPHVVVNEGTRLLVWNPISAETRVIPVAEDDDDIGAVSCIEVDGSPVAAVATDKSGLSIWHLTPGEEERRRPFWSSWPGALASTTTDEEPLVFGVEDDTGYVWNLRSGAMTSFPLSPNTLHYSVACATIDGVPIGMTCTMTSVEAWNLLTGRPLFAPMLKERSASGCIAIGLIDGIPTAASTDGNDNLYLWNLRNGQRVMTIRLPRADQVVLTPDGEIVVSLYSDIVVLHRKAATDH